jgi:hypothetical protein
MQIILAVVSIAIFLKILQEIAKAYGYWESVLNVIEDIEVIVISAIFCVLILAWDIILASVLYITACVVSPINFSLKGLVALVLFVKCIEALCTMLMTKKAVTEAVDCTDDSIFDKEIADELDTLH